MKLAKDEFEARVLAALSAVGAVELADRPAHHLSSGEKRMVSIAGVLAMRPRLLLYDEPSANLDIRSRRRLIRLLQASAETVLGVVAEVSVGHKEGENSRYGCDGDREG